MPQIKGTVLEDTNITFPLRDDGEGPPDEKAGDGVWDLGPGKSPSRPRPVNTTLNSPPSAMMAFRFQIRTKEGEVITLQSERAMRIRSFEESAASWTFPGLLITCLPLPFNRRRLRRQARLRRRIFCCSRSTPFGRIISACYGLIRHPTSPHIDAPGRKKPLLLRIVSVKCP